MVVVVVVVSVEDNSGASVSGSGAVTGIPWTTILTSTTAAVAIPVGPWQAAAITLGRAWGEMRGRTGLIQAVIGVQYTNDVRVPVSSVAVGVVMNADNVFDPAAAGWVTLGTSQYKYWRPVILVSLVSGSALGTASVAGTLETRIT